MLVQQTKRTQHNTVSKRRIRLTDCKRMAECFLMHRKSHTFCYIKTLKSPNFYEDQCCFIGFFVTLAFNFIVRDQML